MTTPMTTLQTRTRLSYLDNLRVVLTALVVLHHAAVTYSHIPLWYYYEAPHDDSATALDVFLALNQAYFMGFFFLIAGYFTPGGLDRKGVGRFARDRLVRLGIPLLLFVIVVRRRRHPGVERVGAAVRGVLRAQLGPRAHLVPRGAAGVFAGDRKSVV